MFGCEKHNVHHEMSQKVSQKPVILQLYIKKMGCGVCDENM